MNDWLKSALSGLCGALAALSESYGVILTLCCAFILVDLATGLAKAKIQGKINSSIGYKGFWRKTALIAALVFGIALDFLVEYVSESGISSPIGRLFGLYIAVNECISICENLSACGVKMPSFITYTLGKMKKSIVTDTDKKHTDDIHN